MGAVLRLATESDAMGMLEIYTPVMLETTISFEEEPPTLEEFRSRIRIVMEHMPWLVCADGDAIAVYAYASLFRTRAAYRWTVELTGSCVRPTNAAARAEPFTPHCCSAGLL